MEYKAPLRDMRFVLHELFDARRHHLLLFSGVEEEEGSATEGDLRRAEARYAEGTRAATSIHAVFARGREPSSQAGWIDVDGAIHEALGFRQAAYILVRPDGYAAHVGPLSALDDMVHWFNELGQ